MLEKARQFIRENIAPKTKLLLACSGGVDSMVLLHLLLQEVHKPAIAHCNFQLRDTATADANFVENVAKAEGLPHHAQSFATQEYAAKNGLSLQMAARDLRYTFFANLRKTHNYQVLLTAHHRDDSLETFFLNLARGTGISGLAGIKAFKQGVLRPLSAHSKEEILSFAQEQSIPWREDASNASLKYHRNFLRHKVIPPLRQQFEGFDKGFSHSLEYLQEQEQALNFMLKEKLQEHLQQDGAYEKLPFSSAPYFQALLHFWLKDLEPVDYPALKRVQQGDSDLNFSTQNFELLYSRGFFWLNRNPQQQKPQPVKIKVDQKRLQSPFALKMERVSAQSLTMEFSPRHAYLDFEKLTFPLLLRPWQKGDRFIPLGMQGHKKISDFLIDQKLNSIAKKNQWVLCSGQKIVWVVGQQIHEEFKITDWTKTIYFVQLLN